MTRAERARWRAWQVLAKGPHATASFAAAMWPDSPAWRGARTVGLVMLAGRFLRRLEQEGRVERDGLNLWRWK
jgi:hypothetical protein